MPANAVYRMRGPGLDIETRGRLEQASGVVMLIGHTAVPIADAQMIERVLRAGLRQTIEVLVDGEVVAFMAARSVRLKEVMPGRVMLSVLLGLA